MLMVVNLRDKPQPEYDVYVGRYSRWAGLPSSKWANPHKMENQTDRERRRVVMLFESDLWNNLTRAHRMRTELRGKTLACWCSPKLCHAHVLSYLANCSDDDYALWEAGFICALQRVLEVMEAPDGDRPA